MRNGGEAMYDSKGWTMRNEERTMRNVGRAGKDGRGYSRTCGGGTDSPAEDGWFARRGA